MATASSRRISNFAPRYSGAHERPRSSDQPKEQIWTPMLEGVSSGKRLPEKSLLVLGRISCPDFDTETETDMFILQEVLQRHNGNS